MLFRKEALGENDNAISTNTVAPHKLAPKPNAVETTFGIVAEDLRVVYNNGTVVAVDNLNLKVPRGRVTGLLGGNGAGKTSTLRAVAGVSPPNSGELWVSGFNMGKTGEAEMARRVIGYCPDTGGLIRQATIREHIGLALGMRRELNRWDEALDLIEQFGLSHVIDRETGSFSHGMSRRLSVVLAALTAHRVLILDEPFDGVDPLGVAATMSLIDRAANAGVAVVISTHLLSLLVKASDHICVMVNGVLVAKEESEKFAGSVGETRYETLLGRR